MRFLIVSEGQATKGQSLSSRLLETVEEAVHAEKMGFDAYGTSEQHFFNNFCSISAPEVLYGAMAQATHSIKLRTMSMVTLKYNHALRIAERLSTIDVLSRGRLEFGTARSNNASYMKPLGADPKTTREEWDESFEVVIRAMTQRPVEFHGKYYDFGPLESVTPRPYAGCPPIYVSASSEETHRMAGALGIGVMTFDTWFGWEYTQKAFNAYDEAAKNPKPIGGLYKPTISKGVFVATAHCAETKERAYAEVRPVAQGFAKIVVSMYGDLFTAGGYDYLKPLKEKLEAHVTDIDYLQEISPSMCIGDPDFCIQRIKRFQEMGADEVILRIDAMGHRTNLRSIEMFGKYVIPAFRNPLDVPAVDDLEAYGVENVPRFVL